jgi:hypothetical protein
MKRGEITDCEGLFDPELWNAAPPSDRRHVFGRPIAMLVAQGKIPLEFAGFDRARHNLLGDIGSINTQTVVGGCVLFTGAWLPPSTFFIHS